MSKVEFQNSDTIVNLCRAFTMESQNAARYKFMAEKASEEKYCYLEELLKKTHDHLMAEAKVFYDLIEQNLIDDGIELEFDDVYPFRKATLIENFLYSADEAELSRDEIYPDYAHTAREEGFTMIAEKFEKMYQIKDCLYMTMSEICERMQNQKLYKSATAVKWKCDNCGYEETGKEAWQKCPFCGFEQGHVVVSIQETQKTEKTNKKQEK